jgi:Na+-translocating ferredoxin:NAD+ oxidoreductase subunit G
MNKITKDALILFAITLIAGVLLGLAHEVTLEPIAKAQEASTQATYAEVYPEAASFEEDEELDSHIEEASAEVLAKYQLNTAINYVKVAKDASGNVCGYLVSAQAKGYGGPVNIAVGISTDMKITGIGFLSIDETPGLGMKAKEESFYGQFPGMPADHELTLTKTTKTSEDQVQAISGATKTSNAVTAATNAAIYFVTTYVNK